MTSPEPRTASPHKIRDTKFEELGHAAIAFANTLKDGRGLFAARRALEQNAEIIKEVGPAGFRAVGLRRRITDTVEAIKRRIARNRRDITSAP